MKALFLHNCSDLYGASRSLVRLTSRLVADGHQVLVVLADEGPLQTTLESAGVGVQVHQCFARIERSRFSTRFGWVKLLWRGLAHSLLLLRSVRAYKPDIIHSNTALVLAGGLVAKLTRRPHIWHIRETFTEFPSIWPVYRRYILGLSDVVVCVSTAIARQFGATSPKVRVINNGIPYTEFEGVSEAAVSEFRQRLTRDADVLIGVIGRVKKIRKGQEVFVRAAAILRGLYPNARFVIIGSPYPGNENHLTDVLSMINENNLGDYVFYDGEAENVKVAHGALDILVLPSALPEPFGGVVLEAMALGKPVVGTNIGGTSDQILDGVTGFLVPPNDPKALADAVGRLLSNPDLRAKMGDAGKLRFHSLFEFEVFYPKILRLYDEALAAPRMAVFASQ